MLYQVLGALLLEYLAQIVLFSLFSYPEANLCRDVQEETYTW